MIEGFKTPAEVLKSTYSCWPLLSVPNKIDTVTVTWRKAGLVLTDPVAIGKPPWLLVTVTAELAIAAGI